MIGLPNSKMPNRRAKGEWRNHGFESGNIPTRDAGLSCVKEVRQRGEQRPVLIFGIVVLLVGGIFNSLSITHMKLAHGRRLKSP
jgi:hypothetical protein